MRERRTTRTWKAKCILTLVPAAGLAWLSAAAGADLPDLVVASAKVTMKCNANGTRTASIFAIVKNQSTTATADLSKSPWNIVLDADVWYTNGGVVPPTYVKPSAAGPKTLKPGGFVARNLALTGFKAVHHLDQQGHEDYGFRVRADPGNTVAEGNETNNEKLVHVALDKTCQPFSW